MGKALIIGSGIGGICCAIRLANAGHEVHIFEANSTSGGKLSQLKLGGYRFDVGPSVFTMPHYIDELFELCGETASDHFKYSQMEESSRFFWEDGTSLNFYHDKKRLAKEITDVLKVDANPTLNHLEKSSTLYKRIGATFLHKSLHKWRTWFGKDVAKALLHLPAYKLNSSMHKVNAKSLNHPKLIQIFDRYATYNGSNPYVAPAILNIIPHFDQNIGTFFPEKGMFSISQSLTELAKRQGVNFHFNSKVERIETDGKTSTGITVNNTFVAGDYVVSNSDVYLTYTKLLPQIETPKKRITQARSSSGLIFYWGIKKSFPQLDLHNVFFTSNYDDEFDTVFNKKTICNDPTIYINITSKKASTDAPKGCENWFVMVNSPSYEGQDWDKLIAVTRTNIIAKLNRIFKIDITPYIEAEDILEPRLINTRLMSHQGSIYGTSSNDRMAAFMRQANFHKTINNLYFCGGSVHPGGGVPISMLSGKLVSELIKKKN